MRTFGYILVGFGVLAAAGSYLGKKKVKAERIGGLIGAVLTVAVGVFLIVNPELE